MDLGHFEIRKENVHISLAPPSERAGALEGLKDAFVIEVRGVRARIPGLKWSFELLTFPYLNSEGLASAVLEGESVISCPGPACLPHLGSPLALTPSPRFLALPAGGSIGLGFRVNPRGATPEQDGSGVGGDATAAHPRLALGSNAVALGEMELEFDGSFFSTVYNYIAFWFQQEITAIVTKLLKQLLEHHLGYLLGRLNKFVEPHSALLGTMLADEVHSRRTKFEIDFSADPRLLFARDAFGTIAVSGFAVTKSAAEETGAVRLGDQLVAVHGDSIVARKARSFKQAVRLLTVRKQEAIVMKTQLCLRFLRNEGTGVDLPFDPHQPLGIKFAFKDGAVLVVGFSQKGPGEISQRIGVGDALLSLNGEPVPSSVSSDEVSMMVCDATYPCKMSFARAPQFE